MTKTLRDKQAALLVAVAALVCASGWLIADVELNFAGHLSGLFYTGSKPPLPPGLVAEHTRRVHDDRGYDGQFYHLIAHDPLNRRGFLAYVDSPRYRWRRIGLPALAYLLAAGNDAYIDGTFVALQLGFVLLGAFWLARCAQMFGMHAAWGLSLLLIPGVAVSLDRMTVDLPVSALTVALLLYASAARPRWLVYAALIAAPLIRETGLLLILAWCVFCVLRRRLRDAALGAACAVPTLAWYLYVALHTGPDRTPFLASFPLGGAITWTLHALSAPTAAYGSRADVATELLALTGIWLALILAVRLIVQRSRDLPALLAVAFALFASLIGYQDIWASAYGLGRTLSPLLLALAVIALRDRRGVFALPLLLNVPRVALQFAAEIWVALRASH